MKAPWIVAGLLAVGAFAAPPSPAAPTLEWTDLCDGGAAFLDGVTAVALDASGHIVVGGESADGEAGLDLFIRKLERETGFEMWSRRWPAFDGSDMALTGLVRDGVGNFLIGGYICGCVG